MYILTDDEKKIIGKIIEFQRKRLSSNFYTKNNPYIISSFILDEFGNHLINERTYTKLCKGIAINNDEAYDCLIKNLD